MKMPLSWLREYVDLPADPIESVNRLASLGFPVEDVLERPLISGVVVGRIAGIIRHPNADRLQLCDLDIGTPEHLTIATAATNVAEGQIVPVALIGAQLPTMRIEPRKMRGVDSQGMLCSAGELGLEPEWFVDGILQLDAGTPLGADVVSYFGLADPILDIEVTANRPDALGILGIARELAAAGGSIVRLPPIHPPGSSEATTLDVQLDSPDVTRFVVQRVAGLHVAPAPMVIQIRLALAGQRPINNLVDISNYVMLELGQPLHFYDADKIAGNTLIVRDARQGEELTTLDDEARTLEAENLIIADAQGVVGVAGVRGGASSEITDATRSIIIEAAHFRGARIRRSALKLGLRTDASARFEKGLAPALTDDAAARAATLLAEIGGSPTAAKAFGAAPLSLATVELKRGAAQALLGFAISDEEVVNGLERLGFTVTTSASGWNVNPPAWRTDVHIAVDVIEEIARIIGYDRIEEVAAPVIVTQISSEGFFLERHLARRIAAAGYSEVVSLSLESTAVRARFARAGCAPEVASIAIRNPLSEDQRYLRFSLLPNLLALLARRCGELREHKLQLFEIGHVFSDLPQDGERNLAVFITLQAKSSSTDADGMSSWRDDGFLRCKGQAEEILRPFTRGRIVAESAHEPGLHPGKTAALSSEDGRRLATIGALDPRLAASYEIDALCHVGIIDLATLHQEPPRRYVAPSRYPGIARDVALVVGADLAASELDRVIRSDEMLVRDVRVFDEYRGAQVGMGRKSLAIRIVFGKADATLTDADADAAVARILAITEREFGAALRR